MDFTVLDDQGDDLSRYLDALALREVDCNWTFSSPNAPPARSAALHHHNDLHSRFIVFTTRHRSQRQTEHKTLNRLLSCLVLLRLWMNRVQNVIPLNFIL